MAGRQGLGKGKAGPHQQPQVVPATGRYRTPRSPGRLPVLPVEDGTLPNRPVSRVGHPPAGRHLLVVSEQDPDSGTPLQELPPVEEPVEDSLGGRPRSVPQAPRDRTSIAELLADERCSQAVLLRQQTSVGRHAHRWPMGLRMRPVRPRSGKRGDRRSGLGREGRRRRGWGGIGGDGFFLSFLNFLYVLCYYFTSAFGG